MSYYALARCKICGQWLRVNSTWRCKDCNTLHVPGWDDSPAQSQDPDEPSPVRGILHGFLLALGIWAVLAGVYALFGGAE